MNKAELITWVRDEQPKWELFLAAIGHGRMDQFGANDEWSMRDIVGPPGKVAALAGRSVECGSKCTATAISTLVRRVDVGRCHQRMDL